MQFYSEDAEIRDCVLSFALKVCEKVGERDVKVLLVGLKSYKNCIRNLSVNIVKCSLY